jgi:spermidine synthase
MSESWFYNISPAGALSRVATVESASPSVELLHHARGERQTLIVEREGSELRLRILSAQSSEWQSRMDLRDPTRLVAPYMQAMMLALLWQPEPSRVHVLGLGGGRIPMFLRRLFPRLEIDCTEIDRDVYELAVLYFGLRPDAHLNVIIEDGRGFLVSCSPSIRYDAIFVDAFCGIGGAPLRISSMEFFAIAKERLTPEGVLAVNVLPGDALAAERLRTIERSFRSTYLCRGDGTLVAFGSNAERVVLNDLLLRAVAFQTRHQCEFSFATMARSLERIDGTSSQPLADASPPDQVEIPEHLLRSIRPSDPCPCGSGGVFSQCHGRAGS